jgi:hypothetical protein
MALLIAGLTGCASFDYLTRVTEEFPKAKQCGKCHIEIYQEWSESDHATAYVNPHYRQMTDDYTFDDCLSCHVPQPTFSDQPPTVRAMDRDEGITCVSCHLEQGKHSGPLEPTGKVAPHPIGVRPEVYRDAGICGRCHQDTLRQWNSVTNEKKTCQECHMSEVVRKMTQSSGGFSDIIVSMEHEAPQRRHDFAIKTPESVKDMVIAEVRRIDTDVAVSLHNHLPHSLPTGDYGFRILVLELFVLDDQGTEQPIMRVELAPEMKTHIPAQGTWEHRVTIPDGNVSLRLRLRRLTYWDQPELDLMNQTMEIGRDNADG